MDHDSISSGHTKDKDLTPNQTGTSLARPPALSGSKPWTIWRL